MPYEYLDNVATADAAFEASGKTMEEMFIAAADATMNVMVGDLDTIEKQQQHLFYIEAESVEMLLFDFLQELIFYKDAEQLLLRVPHVSIRSENNHFVLTAEAYGEILDAQKHELIVDVKAVTFHRFQVSETVRGWKSVVILDV